jgi:hypothetical protein
MAYVHVSVKNNTGNTVVLLLDDERDAEKIEYFRKLVRREDLDSVKVRPVESETASEPEEKPEEETEEPSAGTTPEAQRRGPGRPRKN